MTREGAQKWPKFNMGGKTGHLEKLPKTWANCPEEQPHWPIFLGVKDGSPKFGPVINNSGLGQKRSDLDRTKNSGRKVARAKNGVDQKWSGRAKRGHRLVVMVRVVPLPRFIRGTIGFARFLQVGF